MGEIDHKVCTVIGSDKTVQMMDPTTLTGDLVRPYTDEELDELSEILKERGMLQPIMVQQHCERYQVTEGLKQWQAALRAGLSEIPVIVGTPVDPLVIARLRAEENAFRQFGDYASAAILLLATHLDQPAATVFTHLTEIDNLFNMLRREKLSTEQTLHLRMLRQHYTPYKRQLNQHAKKQTKYLLDDGFGGLQIGFKFDGQWYAVHSNPPEHLRNVRQAWRITLDDVLDPDQL
jgi:hypothetical protein